jgi:myosin V
MADQARAVLVKDAVVGGLLFTRGLFVRSSPDDQHTTVRLDSGGELEVPTANVHLANGDETPDDHAELTHLSEATVLENTRLRYADDRIYTWVSRILIAVNPFKPIEHLVGDAAMRSASGGGGAPHVYAVAESALRELRRRRKHQSIVVSGESGAGKSESNKLLLQYIVWVSPSTALSGQLNERLLQFDPVLAAFGNAKTVRSSVTSRRS